MKIAFLSIFNFDIVLFFCFFFSIYKIYLLNNEIIFILQIDLKHKNQMNNTNNMVELGIDLREYYPSVEWDILGVPAERHEKYYPCCAEPYPGKIFTLKKRIELSFL
jgi:hypothetical protein